MHELIRLRRDAFTQKNTKSVNRNLNQFGKLSNIVTFYIVFMMLYDIMQYNKIPDSHFKSWTMFGDIFKAISATFSHPAIEDVLVMNQIPPYRSLRLG